MPLSIGIKKFSFPCPLPWINNFLLEQYPWLVHNVIIYAWTFITPHRCSLSFTFIISDLSFTHHISDYVTLLLQQSHSTFEIISHFTLESATPTPDPIPHAFACLGNYSFSYLKITLSNFLPIDYFLLFKAHFIQSS
jgi:hypothetical protein